MKAKIQNCLNLQIRPVYCVGEKLNERKDGSYKSVVQKQINEVLKEFSTPELEKILIAYEPVWAIGTGETARPDQAQEMHAFIRQVLSDEFSSQLASTLPLLYGGSCNPLNAKELFSCPDVDGGLIGGASLQSANFCKIIRSFS
jgi:triosephosphate isomerase